MISNEHVEFGMETIPVGSAVPLHSHPEQSEILFIHKGRVKIGLGNEVFDLQGGMAVNVPKGVEHFIRNDGDSEVILTYTLTPPTKRGLTSLDHISHK